MAYLLDHKQMVSLRGKEYAFNLEGELPDWRDETSRQLYMDSFILFALPVDSDIVGRYRLQAMTTVLEHLTRHRYQWLQSARFSIKVDHVMSTETKGPLECARAVFPRGSTILIYKAWRTGMGLTCGYPSFKDETSTEAMLSDVSSLSTEERWCTTRGVMPVKQKQTQSVQSEEVVQWPPKLSHWPASQEGETVQAAVARSPAPSNETPLLSGLMRPNNLEESVTLESETDTLFAVLRHIFHVRAKQSSPVADIFATLKGMYKGNPILRYRQERSPAAPSRDEVARDLRLESGLSHETVLDLLQCETMMSTIWTLPDFHLLAGPVSMRARHKEGFLIDKGDESAMASTNRAFLEWDGSRSLEAVIDALVTPTTDTNGRCKPYLLARPDILQVIVGSVKADVRPPRELDVWIGYVKPPRVYYQGHHTQH
ncbi:unnamed protein product [Clonostachys chloroleuca]|uniref:Uncharacterized protein n=1 Tax=Clonostachys chloroleuca TaxID=1926264 RepID=A0AA35M9Z4_9HYPO|nr:unnamed protein product [Clonostachys chloroleuca]